MTTNCLEAAIQQHGNAVEMLRNSKCGIYVYPVVAPEFSNWRDEQKAWREEAVLFDQCHHMDELIVEGPDAAKLLEGLAVNSFAKFGTNRAKHFVAVNPDGQFIGDMIMFREREDKFILVGRAPAANWIEFNHSIGSYNCRVHRDPRSPSRPDGKSVVRTHYRYEIQGPKAPLIFEQMNGGPLPEIKFFHVDWINVGDTRVQALRHGMAGAPGLEIWGPYDQKDHIRDAIMRAAKEVGVNLCLVGSRAYPTTPLESGWIPSPLPAIYTGGGIMEQYRKWLPADGYEAAGSIGGSYVSDDITDYYATPEDLGYGFYVKFDHDFIGREALEKMQDTPQRKKVTFEWNADDVVKVVASAFKPGEEHYKWIDLPLSNYASSSYDSVMKGDKVVGMSMYAGYSYNERSMLSLGIVDADVEVGDVLTMVWGEPDGGSGKNAIERHKQAEIRVRVSTVPYSSLAREGYGGSWRVS